MAQKRLHDDPDRLAAERRTRAGPAAGRADERHDSSLPRLIGNSAFSRLAAAAALQRQPATAEASGAEAAAEGVTATAERAKLTVSGVGSFMAFHLQFDGPKQVKFEKAADDYSDRLMELYKARKRVERVQIEASAGEKAMSVALSDAIFTSFLISSGSGDSMFETITIEAGAVAREA